MTRHTCLYRDPEHGILLGVCAGVAEYFGIRRCVVRIGAIFSLMVFSLPTLFAYAIAGFLLPQKPARLYASDSEASFWRGVRVAPERTARDLRHRFRELERRLRALEAYITSKEFALRREIDGLEK